MPNRYSRNLQWVSEQSASPDDSTDRPELVAARFSRLYLDAVRAADAAGAFRVVTAALDQGMAVPALYQRVIAPALHEIGGLWEKGALTEADEHMATALTHRVLAALRPPITSGSVGIAADLVPPKRAMLATVEGEQHALGLRMAADLLEDAGFRTFYLGADVPSEALLRAVSSLSPDLVALSATMPELAAKLEEEVTALHRANPALEVLFGGQAASPRIGGGTLVDDLEALPGRLGPQAQV